MTGSVAILDAGAQYCKVIDRRVRELCVRSEIFPLSTPVEKLKNSGFNSIIISGGPSSVMDQNCCSYDPQLFDGSLPVLGICYGMQLMTKVFGGRVESKTIRRDGQLAVKLFTTCAIFKGIQEDELALFTHSDLCTTIPPGFDVIATSGSFIVAIAKPSQQMYGVQFHPEVNSTPFGIKMIKNFLFNVCGLKSNFEIPNRLEGCLTYIKEKVGENKVLILVSGGVDSTVCSVMASKALRPEQIVAVHINNGFMRKGESEAVVEALRKLGIKVHSFDATFRFQSGMTTYQVRVETAAIAPASLLSISEKNKNAPPMDTNDAMMEPVETEGSGIKISLRQNINGGVIPFTEIRNIPIGPLNSTVVNPEEKRRIIGDVFLCVAEEAWISLDLDLNEFILCQGTLRPDLIESGSDSVSSLAETIKTHHNVTAMAKHLAVKGRLVEPLADFHKDEVRQLGKLLGLPGEIIDRHPFPGPGLAVRIICASEAYAERDFLETTSLIKMIAGYNQMSQKPHVLLSKINSAINQQEQQRLLSITEGGNLAAHLLPIRTVGVQGDCRTYSYACAISTSSEYGWNELHFIAQIIPRICHNINRVVYAFGPKIAYPVNDVTVTYLREPIIATLREVDARVNAVLQNSDCMNAISQMPVILIPIHFDRDPTQMTTASSILRSVVLRPFISSDFMTGFPAIPGIHLPVEVVSKMVEVATQVPGISRVLYDLTPKPPATTEWE